MRHSWIPRGAWAVVTLAAVAGPLPGQEKAEPVRGELHSNRSVLGLPLAERKEGIHQVGLKFELDQNGKGKGVLMLDPNGLRFDEFGNVEEPIDPIGPLARIELECRLALVKEHKKAGQRVFEVTGPKIKSRLGVMLVAGKESSEGRLLVRDKNGNVKYAINLGPPMLRIKPCHPGCFPAGTAVEVPGGSRPIERLRAGDLVTSIDADGKPESVRVTGVFVTRNRLLEVRTEFGTLVTTETQPVGLEGGEFRAAGELKAGARVCRWVNGERRAVSVLGVSPADREAEVFNLILGGTRAFIAGGFVVRSKPPGAEARVGPAAAVGPSNQDPR